MCYGRDGLDHPRFVLVLFTIDRSHLLPHCLPLSDLRAQQSDGEFNSTLSRAIDEIYAASTEKVPA